MKKHILLVMAVSLLTFGLFTSCDDGGWDGLAFEKANTPSNVVASQYSGGTRQIRVTWNAGQDANDYLVFFRQVNTRTILDAGATVDMIKVTRDSTTGASTGTIAAGNFSYDNWEGLVTVGTTADSMFINGRSYQFGVASIIPAASENSVRSDIAWGPAINITVPNP